MLVTVEGKQIEVGLREAWNYISEEEWKGECRKAELQYFHETHRYCGKCGSPTAITSEISVKCESCGSEYFPSLSPAIVVLVKREDRALLVHAANFKLPMYALVARADAS